MNKILSFVALVLVVLVGAQMVSAQAGTNLCTSNPSYGELTGWAWSSTIGWISFNSSNAGSGGGSYKVCVSPSGDLGGYGWSSNVGWVSFEAADALSCPSGAGAHIDLTTGSTRGTASGFVRAIKGFDPTAGGWDGCIKLAGVNHTSDPSGTGGASAQGVAMNPTTGAFTGFAWGDMNVGWLSFDSGIAGGRVICDTCITGGSPLSVSCYIPTPQTVPVGSTANLIPQVIISGGTKPYGTYTTNRSFDGIAAGSYAAGYFSVSVTDAASNTAAGQCNAVTITEDTGGGTPSPITLTIGRTVPGATATALAVTKGDSFALKWLNEAPVGAQCSASVIRAGTPDATNWTVWTEKTSGELRINGNVFPVPTDTTMSSGTYTFKMTCDNATPANAADDSIDSVNLILNSSTQIEI
jgi:hypothetical protein